MQSIFKKSITTIFILIILLSLFHSITSLGSAGPITDRVFTLQSNIDLQWASEEASKPMVPRDEIRTLNLTLLYSVDWSRYISQGAYEGYNNSSGLVVLDIIDHSPWVQANLKHQTVLVKILTNPEPYEAPFSMNILIDHDAPAYGEGFVKIRTFVRQLGFIHEFSREFTLNFIAGYLPIIGSRLIDGNTREISPDEPANFKIELENFGNARTKILFDVIDVPEGWSVAIPTDVLLDEIEGSTAIADLTIIPPKIIGYSYDEVTIDIKMTPARAENLLDQGHPIYQTFLIQNKGFFTPGFDAITVIALFLFVCVLIKYKKKK
ncbi:MAG: hypothetical protein R6V50_08255 [Thermoplasmatota archaeon]